ncbi:MAG TPA: tetratricopeptide repeat protein, partial [Spirochaetota bacterium]
MSYFQHMNRILSSFFILLFSVLACVVVPSGMLRSPAYAAEAGSPEKELADHDRAVNEAYAKGDYRTAIAELRVSIAIAAKLYGEQSSANAQRYNTLGFSQYYAGDYSGSLKSHEQALVLFGAENDANRLSRAVAQGGVASAQMMTGSYDQSIISAEKALDIYKRTTLSKDEKSYPASVYFTIGLAYQYKGMYEKSDEYMMRARDQYKESFGDRHPYIASVMYELGETAKLRGDHPAARRLYEKSLEIYIATLGDKHPYVGSVYYALAYEYHFEGELDKSITYYIRACELYRNAYGENHPFVAIAYYGLGRVFSDNGEFDRAIAYLTKAREIDLGVFGEEHINTIATCFGLAETLMKGGRGKEAFPY